MPKEAPRITENRLGVIKPLVAQMADEIFYVGYDTQQASGPALAEMDEADELAGDTAEDEQA